MKRSVKCREVCCGSAVRRLLALFLVLACVFLWVGNADARVGGGGSFSGGGGGGFGGGGGGFGGGSYSGGGGGGGGDLPAPVVFVIVVVVIVIGCVAAAVSERQKSSRSYSSAQAGGRQSPKTIESRLEQLRQYDPNFSEILFMDFAYALYAKVQEARGRGDLKTYRPYLGDSVVAAVDRLPEGFGKLREVRGVIVGGAQIHKVGDPQRDKITISVRFETNYTEIRDGSSGSENTFYCEEIWKFTRNRNVLSRPPEKIRALGCPNCGSTAEREPDDSCQHCGVKMIRGKFHWFARSIQILRRESRGPLLTSDVPEVGTCLPTVFQANFNAVREQFLAATPRLSWKRTEARFAHIFKELQQAWTTLQWERARPYESDQLFQFHCFWIQEYKRQKLRNVLEDIDIERIRPVKIKADAFYDAITVRIWASMKDYTVDTNANVVCGNPRRARSFTEYWTFIRRRGVKESDKEVSRCPNCGAPLKINMAGICEHCEGKITSGEFDWVLSRIEQDEAYVS